MKSIISFYKVISTKQWSIQFNGVDIKESYENIAGLKFDI